MRQTERYLYCIIPGILYSVPGMIYTEYERVHMASSFLLINALLIDYLDPYRPNQISQLHSNRETFVLL